MAPADDERNQTRSPAALGRSTGRHPSLQRPPVATASRRAAAGDDATMALSGSGASVPAADAAVVDLAAGEVLDGVFSWRIVRRLGVGGYGAVYLADRVQDGRIDAPADRAAIKVFFAPPDVDPGQLLRRELSALLALRSPRIPRVLDWAADAQRGFVAIDFIAGGSLFDAMQRQPRARTADVWRLLLDLLEALRVAHHAAVQHLDVKPGNVLIDDDGGYVLTDFGIAQGSFVSQVVGAAGLGTRGYQAPEQRRLDNDAIDARTDLWGVGATAFAMAAGVDLSRRLDLVRERPDPETRSGLPPLATVAPGADKALAQAIAMLTAYDAVERPGGAAEALALVRRLLSGHRSATSTAVELRGHVDASEAEGVLAGLLDPLWQAICADPGARDFLVRYSDGELLCREGERSYHAFALLRGVVRVERGGRLLTTIDREGTFLGEVSTLGGTARTASMRAQGPVFAMLFNAAELEQFLVANPVVTLRLVHSLCERLERESKLQR